jgi:RNA polymerase sigma-70 factor (ECF subfamily)
MERGKLDDREIIRRCQLGQRAMLDLLIGRYEVPLYTLCRRLARERADADDLYQDTWCRAVKNLGRFDPERAFRPWLFALCVNRYRDRYRLARRWNQRIAAFFSRREHEAAMAGAPSRDPGADTLLARGELANAAKEIVAELDDIYRVPVILHYYRGLTMGEIAEALGVPAGTVKSRLAEARNRIRATLEEQGHG